MIEIQIIEKVNSPEILGSDGDRLGVVIADALRDSTGDVRLNFSGVSSATASSACRFFLAIVRARGSEATKRLVFTHASSWVMDSFEVGLEQVLSQHQSA